MSLGTAVRLRGESCRTFVPGKAVHSFPPRDIGWEMTVCVFYPDSGELSGTLSLSHARTHTHTHKTLEDVQLCHVQTDKAVVVSSHKAKVSDKHSRELNFRLVFRRAAIRRERNADVNASSSGFKFSRRYLSTEFPDNEKYGLKAET